MLNFLFSFDGCSQPRKQAIGSSYTSDDRPKQTISYKTSIKFEDFRFLNKISKAKFPVHLVEATSINKKLAMKIFPFRDDQPSPRYQNEIRFSHLCHHNVIAMIDYKEEEINNLQDDLSVMSYIVMEYAPYGDLFDLVMNSGIDWHDKLVRTYFHQLVQGLEYLHSNGIAHLDLKLENVLIGENFVLKIADFDLSHFIRDEKVHTKGTKNYRPPELLRKKCEDAQAADVYSIGIMLFVMKCEGVLPYLEDKPYKGIDLFDLLHNKPAVFWENHIRIQKKGRSFFDPSFKALFMSMTQLDPKKRATLREIQASQWYRGPIYSEKELTSFMRDAWELLH